MRRILVTSGEPAGIGPELCLHLAGPQDDCELIILADQHLLQARAEQLHQPVDIINSAPNSHSTPTLPRQLKVWHLPLQAPAIAGQLNVNNAIYVLQTLDLACNACLAGHAHGMVTAPVHKGIINAADIPFHGHTEYLQQLCHSQQTVMMLACETMRVALVTTHLPLQQVAAAITSERLRQVTQVLHQALRQQFAITEPCIYVCGLNPHAGEQGHLGHEEVDIITPTLNSLRQQGFNLVGPLPADTLFHPANLARADCILAMYHDQGLPVLKHASFGSAVNITLGLPIIRTSVDHGTALDLAGTGKASAISLQQAVKQALQMH